MNRTTRVREDLFLLAAGLGFIIFLIVTTAWDIGAWVVGWFRSGVKS